MTDEELTKLEALVDETDWLLQGCSSKFRVEIPALIAEVRRWQREAALRSAQLLMVGSELAGDSKLHFQDRGDPRWTPTLQEAWAAREKIREDVGIARAEKAEAACAELQARVAELRDQSLMAPSARCRAFHVQNCSFCDDAACGDNQHPAVG